MFWSLQIYIWTQNCSRWKKNWGRKVKFSVRSNNQMDVTVWHLYNGKTSSITAVIDNLLSYPRVAKNLILKYCKMQITSNLQNISDLNIITLGGVRGNAVYYTYTKYGRWVFNTVPSCFTISFFFLFLQTVIFHKCSVGLITLTKWLLIINNCYN